MGHEEVDLYKAMILAAVEKVGDLVRDARNMIAKPKARAKLNDALKELLKITPDEALVEQAIREGQRVGYTDDELQRAISRLHKVQESRMVPKKKKAAAGGKRVSRKVNRSYVRAKPKTSRRSSAGSKRSVSRTSGGRIGAKGKGRR